LLSFRSHHQGTGIIIIITIYYIDIRVAALPRSTGPKSLSEYNRHGKLGVALRG
jgi:hypothetical protein